MDLPLFRTFGTRSMADDIMRDVLPPSINRYIPPIDFIPGVGMAHYPATSLVGQITEEYQKEHTKESYIGEALSIITGPVPAFVYHIGPFIYVLYNVST